MKHIEVSGRIATTQEQDVPSVKHALVQRMRSAFYVETVGEGEESFSVTATSKKSAYAFSLNVSLKTEPERIRILMDGTNDIQVTTKIFYVASILIVLVLSVFLKNVGIAEHSEYSMIATAAMFTLVVGGFVVYDYARKLDEPEQILQKIFTTLDAEYG